MIFPEEDNNQILTVSMLTDGIKLLLEGHFGQVSVRGEVSQPKMSGNGHLYFTLKDSGAQLSCVMWSSSLLHTEHRPEHGDEVIVSGPIQVYAPHGRYQMIARSVVKFGAGALQQAFERLKKKLSEEGLFDPARKRILPAIPQVIGIVTSAAGAAFQDMCNTLEKRFPICRIQLYHASVQGVQAAPEISAGIHFFSGKQNVDLVIIGRGGGSLEDLWAFNEESVARAIAGCRIPVISAVGHETDFSIADFVADVRAATPTQAIILAVPEMNDLLMRLEDQRSAIEKRLLLLLNRQKETVSRFLDNYALHKVRQRIQSYLDGIQWQKKQLHGILQNRLRQNWDQNRLLSELMAGAVDKYLYQKKSTYREMHQRLETANPNAPLLKGYTRIHQENHWIRSGSHFVPEKPFKIEWADRSEKIG